METKSTFIERYSMAIFLILTPLLSLAIPILLALPAEVVPLLIAIIPAFMAITLTAMTSGRKGVGALLKKRFQWRVGSKWYFIAIGLAFVLRFTMSLLALLFGWIPAIQVRLWSPAEFVIIGSFILIGGAMEELGWRGYLLPKLLDNRSVLFSALFSGVIWGVLHLALNLPGQMNAGAHWLPTILQLIGLSVVLTWLFVRAGGSIVIPILFHAGQNLLVIVNGGITLTQQLWLMTIVTLPLAAILMVFFGSNLQPVPTEQQTVVEAG
jgi:membrane protease YdiL (CAAX protease family)